MTVSSGALLADLQGRVRRLEDDLREQVGRLPELSERLRSDYALAQKTERTAEPWTSWLDAQATQAAVSWVLGCVFVRFCEDNNLTDKRWIAGLADASGDGLARAVDAQAAWIQANPRENERGWLREAFGWLRGTHAGSSLFPDTDFVWWWDISADAAADLLAFFRRRGPEGGGLAHRFDSPDWDTRFLGDLYQDLSEAARKRYALLQTPEFVEEFILDLTLDPALDTFGLDGLRMIDPACGSGHFLLGAFHRILTAWTEQQPGLEARQRVQRALDSVHGVDINAAATAIAKFRLTVAALRTAGASGLDSPDAPAFTLNIATGDSLIWGSGGRQTHADIIGNQLTLDEHHYAWEDIDQHPGILRPGSYHAVVANPPYITVKDKALNQAYRQRYQTCHRQYAMSVPFAELLFRLAIRDQDAPGIIGQITANSFMKREFGKKLVEEFLTTVDLTHVIDTSGAYIPGHGTPTVILIGNRRYPTTDAVRAILGIRGEPSAPPDPAKGHVWRSIIEDIGSPGVQNDYISVVDLSRKRLIRHPWSLAGGGADGLKALIDSDRHLLKSVADSVGYIGQTNADEAFFASPRVFARFGVEKKLLRQVAIGELVRDYAIGPMDEAIFPYVNGGPSLDSPSKAHSWLWPNRTIMGNRATFAKITYFEEGRPWFEWHQVAHQRLRDPRSLTYAFVATHNHFVFDRSGQVGNRSAPVIKLPEGAGEDDHLRLLGLLNSSTACFWLKQVSHNKGSTVDQHGARQTTVEWENFYEFTGTKLQEFPLPERAPLDRARRLDALAQELASLTPQAVAEAELPTREALAEARTQWEAIRAEMIALQEELDWEVYRHYGVLDDDLTYGGVDLPKLALGERAFEIVLARKMKAGEVETEWFNRHRSTPITKTPEHWPQAYRDLVAKRIELIESHPLLHLIERPECKRRWATRPWQDMQRDALTDWILDRLEAPELWRDEHGPRVLSIAQLADLLRGDTDLRSVLTLLTGRPDHDLTTELARLLKDEAVPFLAAHRYKESGMRTRAAWEHTWDLQRREDAGENVGDIPIPPKYTSADFRSTAFWRHRGKLDVPKERFIGYPGTGRDADKTPVIGWAGWHHLQQAQALARLILDRSQQDGWQADRLTPLLAGLAELEPWLHQWHNQLDPVYGSSPAAFYTTFLDEQLQRHSITRQAITDWRPPTTTRRGRPRSLT